MWKIDGKQREKEKDSERGDVQDEEKEESNPFWKIKDFYFFCS
jgi:hypothetical protein